MKCAWDAFIHLLPVRFREEINKLGKNTLQEVRLRLGLPPELVMNKNTKMLTSSVTQEDLKQCIQYASHYSPWSSNSIGHGYITGPGGHRIGIFGRFISNNNGRYSLQSPSMLCLRVARDFDGLVSDISSFTGSVLIIGAPGTGKTTLLRDLVRMFDRFGIGNISVVDEREEIFPRYQDMLCFFPGNHTDVLSGCNKATGIEWALRNMTPSLIVTDEITAQEDSESLLHAAWCGVRLIATAHAGSKDDLYSRPVYHSLLQHNLFQTLLVMHSDKSWHAERLDI